MLVLRRDDAGWHELAFEVPNDDDDGPPARYLVAPRKVEEDTGLDFDAALGPADQEPLEAATARSVW